MTLSTFSNTLMCGSMAHAGRRIATLLVAALMASALVGESPQAEAAVAEPTPLSATLVDGPNALIPPDKGHTVHHRQPLSMLFRVENVSVETMRESLEVALLDITDGSTVTLPATVGETTFGVFRAVTDPAVLVEGHVYQAVASLASDTGKVPLLSWSFAHLPFNVTAARARIKGTPGKSEEGQDWSFLPAIDIAPFQVAVGEVKHSGWGPVGQTIPLGSARVEYMLDGIPGAVPVDDWSAEESVTVYSDFSRTIGQRAGAVEMAGQTVGVRPVTVALPLGAVGPVLVMEPVAATPAVPAAACMLPSVAAPACSPDPLRFFTPEDFAAEHWSFLQINAADPAVTLANQGSVLTQLVGDSAEATAAPFRWIGVTVDHGVVAISYDKEVLAFVDGVLYPGTARSITPTQFEQACELGFPCTARAAEASNTSTLRSNCLEVTGRELEMLTGTQRDQCRQMNFMVWLQMAEPDSEGQQPKYRFEAGVRSQIGYADNAMAYPAFEEIGVGWDDGGGWQMAPDTYDRFELAGADVYYCTNATKYETDLEIYKHRFVYDFKASYNARTAISPYGAAARQAFQWGRTADAFPSLAANAECDYYSRAHSGRLVRRSAVARFRTHLVDVAAVTNRAQFEGTAVASFGHKWSEWTYDWSIGVEVGCTTSGCGPSAGFSFTPYMEDRAAYFSYVKNYSHGF